MNIHQQRINWIQATLEETLQPTFLAITDDSAKHIGHSGAQGGAGHFTVEIAAQCFENKTLIACHRLVYAALASAIPEQIHALQIKIC